MKPIAQWLRVSLIISVLAVMALFMAACETNGNDGGANGPGEPTPEPFDGEGPALFDTPTPGTNF